MTPQEMLAAKKTAALIRAARKKKGLTQIDIANHLGISQSALSKLENRILIPSAPQWFSFCELAGISPETLLTGQIDRGRVAALEAGKSESGFKVPKKYLESRGSKVRAMLPFIHYFRSTFGEDQYRHYLDYVKMDEDFFVDLDNQVNLNFCLDISRHMIMAGVLKQKDFSKLVKPVAQPEFHGKLHTQYDADSDSAHLVTVLLENSKHYECNFQYQVEDHKKNLVVISVKPEKHLSDFKYKDDATLGDFLCKYKQHYFERFSAYGGGKGGTLTESECHFKGADRCVYQLRLAS